MRDVNGIYISGKAQTDEQRKRMICPECGGETE